MITEKNRLIGPRFQFRLRSLFGLVTAAAVVFGGAGFIDRRLSQESRLVREIQLLGDKEREEISKQGEFEYLPGPGASTTIFPKYLRHWDLSSLRPDYIEVVKLEVSGKAPSAKAASELDRFSRLFSLGLMNSSLADQDLDLLAKLVHLQDLYVSSDRLDGTFVRKLPKNGELHSLDVSSELLNDEGVAAICELRSLTELTLNGFQLERPETLEKIESLKLLKRLSLDGQFPEVGFSTLARLNQLESLLLLSRSGNLDDKAFGEVCRCANLRYLCMFNLRLTQRDSWRSLTQLRKLDDIHLTGEFPDEGLESLAELPQLREAALRSPSLTREGVRRLSTSRSISRLSLVFCDQIDDGCIECIAQMPALVYVSFYQSKVTADGVARLKGLRPDLEVVRYPVSP